jgi:hypothetical protein
MSVEVEAILARARRSMEELERLSAIAERLAKEAKFAPVSPERQKSSVRTRSQLVLGKEVSPEE